MALLGPAAARAGLARAVRAGPRGPRRGAAAWATTDLCDAHLPDPVDEAVARKAEAVRPGLLRDFGGRRAFSGPISTVQAFENNPLVREALGEPGNGRVLVVDGGASLRCALLGDEIAAMGSRNGWQGIVLNACVRDSAELAGVELGIKALGTHPLKSSKRDRGLRDVEVHFGGVRFRPGAWLYADADGVLVCTEPGRPLEA